MNQTSSPQPVAPPEAENANAANAPAESAALTAENLLEPSPPTAQVPSEILEWIDERYYPYHWGINE
jgi:hypothetical protein